MEPLPSILGRRPKCSPWVHGSASSRSRGFPATQSAARSGDPLSRRAGLGHSRRQDVELRPGLLDPNTGPEPGDDSQIMRPSLRVGYGAFQRHPKLGVARPQGSQWRAIYHAYHRIIGPIQRDAFADYVACAIELAPPQLGADQDDGVRSGLMFVGAKCAAGDRLHTQHRKIVL